MAQAVGLPGRCDWQADWAGGDLETLDLGPTRAALRRARASDVPVIVGMLAADQLGATRDRMGCAGDLAAYQAAFEPSTATRRTCW